MNVKSVSQNTQSMPHIQNIHNMRDSTNEQQQEQHVD